MRRLTVLVLITVLVGVGSFKTVRAANPTITQISPNSVMAGSLATTVTVFGSGFDTGSTVQWNGAPRTTDDVDAAQGKLYGIIRPTDLLCPGTGMVTVRDSLGGISNGLPFTLLNHAPSAVDDSDSTAEDVPVSVPVLDNDSGNDDPSCAEVLAIASYGQGASGTVSESAGELVYTPSLEFSGTDSFTYTISDGQAPNTLSNVATVTITVSMVNDPPVADDDSYSTNEEQPLSVAAPGVLLGDSDAEGSVLSAMLVLGPSNGAVTLRPNGSFIYTPTLNFLGTDTFTYRASDGVNLSNTATVSITVNPVNDEPTFVGGGNVTVAEDSGPATFDPWATSISPGPADEAGQTVSFIVTGNTNSALFAVQPSVSPTGTLRFTPALNASGVATITLVLQDNGGTLNGGDNTSPPYQFRITISGENDAPVAVDNQPVSTNEDTAVNFTLSVINPDVGQTLAYTITSGPSNGSLSGTAPNLTYTPNPNYSGADSFSYQVCDNGAPPLCDTGSVSITVNPVNDRPLADNDGYTTAEDTPLSVPAPGVLVGDSDVEGQTLTAQLVGGPSSGSLWLRPDGSFIYTPTLNFNGTATFTYQANDGQGVNNLSLVATVTITITAINDAPVANDQTVTTTEDIAVNITLTAGNPEVNQTLSYTVTSGPVNGSLSGTAPNLTYTPDNEFTGQDSFTFIVCDNGAPPLCDTGLVTINVTQGADVFLPLIMNIRPPAPDLVMSMKLTPNKTSFTAGEPVLITLVVTNQGSLATNGPFWVDFYINPTTLPAVNNTWDVAGCSFPPQYCFGIGWMVSPILQPGQAITLTSASYQSAQSYWRGWFPTGTNNIYAYVDVYNPGVSSGGVPELDESNNMVHMNVTVTGFNPPVNDPRALSPDMERRVRPMR